MSRARRGSFAAAGLLVATSGCFHVHGEGNAPAHVSLEEPAEGRAEELDPGERSLLLGAGLLGGVGLVDVPGGVDAAGIVGIEASAHLGDSERSHSEDGMAWPERALGLNAGLSLGAFGREATRGTGYLELQATSEASAVAAGWAFPLLRDASGPQLTLSLGPFFLRGAWMIDDGGEVIVGTVIKPWGTFTESR